MDEEGESGEFITEISRKKIGVRLLKAARLFSCCVFFPLTAARRPLSTSRAVRDADMS